MKSFTCIMFFVLYFGHNGQRHYWSKSLKVLLRNGYNTYLYIQKMGFGLTTHPINPHVYENLYAI